MRRDDSLEEREKLIADAKILAQFANLTTENVESFQRDNPDFFPTAWWDYKPTPPIEADVLAMKWPEMQWQIVQRFIQGAWRKRFQLSTAGFVTLLGSVFDPEKMNTKGLPAALGEEMANLKDFPYHTVARWLVGQSWRVKQCEWCSKCFVAEASQRKYCGTEDDASCFWAYRKAYKQKHWEDNSANVNEHRRQEYRASKGKSPRKSVKKKTVR